MPASMAAQATLTRSSKGILSSPNLVVPYTYGEISVRSSVCDTMVSLCCWKWGGRNNHQLFPDCCMDGLTALNLSEGGCFRISAGSTMHSRFAAQSKDSAWQ